MENEKILLTDYNKLVNQECVTLKDYGKWIQFKESFPILTQTNTFIEVLLNNGEPTIHSIWCDNNTVRIRDYDFHQELLLWHLDECMELYWRYMPDPPGNCGYSVG